MIVSSNQVHIIARSRDDVYRLANLIGDEAILQLCSYTPKERLRGRNELLTSLHNFGCASQRSNWMFHPCRGSCDVDMFRVPRTRA